MREEKRESDVEAVRCKLLENSYKSTTTKSEMKVLVQNQSLAKKKFPLREEPNTTIEAEVQVVC